MSEPTSNYPEWDQVDERELPDGFFGEEPMSEPTRPEVVCLCGSTRFMNEFIAANKRLTLAGRIVLTVGAFGHHDPDIDMDGQVKVNLDELHKRKIDLADSILVLNVGGYIGDSTRSEITYAEQHGKRIDYLEEP